MHKLLTADARFGSSFAGLNELAAVQAHKRAQRNLFALAALVFVSCFAATLIVL